LAVCACIVDSCRCCTGSDASSIDATSLAPSLLMDATSKRDWLRYNFPFHLELHLESLCRREAIGTNVTFMAIETA
jgi:hypothetical protein